MAHIFFIAGCEHRIGDKSSHRPAAQIHCNALIALDLTRVSNPDVTFTLTWMRFERVDVTFTSGSSTRRQPDL